MTKCVEGERVCGHELYLVMADCDKEKIVLPYDPAHKPLLIEGFDP